MRVFLFCLLFPFLCSSQQLEVVDFLKIDALLRTVSEEKKILGECQVTFKMLKSTDTVYMDAVNFKLLNNYAKDVKIIPLKNRWAFVGDFEAGTRYTVGFGYEATPRQTLYFAGNQIWTQGQGKYTSHWLPSIDNMNDKIEFDLQFYTENDDTVISNGDLVDVNEVRTSKTWKYDMQKPMSSYLVAFVMGDFIKKELTSANGVPIELYLSSRDSAKMEPTYRYTKEIFDFFETEIGVDYPWQNYKQVPVRDFLYAGMENTSCTIFSEAFVVDKIGFQDRNYVNVNAHELAHQWFGNLVTETESTHHWLHEGFATYYALLAERAVFGDDYYYWKLMNSAESLEALSSQGKGESLLNPKASSLTFYEKGAWALHMLKELIGEEPFRKAVKNYLVAHSFGNVTTEDFLVEVRAVTTIDISSWEADWLQQSAFKAEQAYNSLLKSPFVEAYFAVAALRSTPLADKQKAFNELLKNPDDYKGQEVVYQLTNAPKSQSLPFYKLALQSDNLLVRQAVATTLTEVPQSIQTAYEGLLSDQSYTTQEAALYHLWSSFPDKQKDYLEQSKSWIGFHNMNLRQLWLALAIVTKDYKPSAKPIFKEELRSYTSDLFSFEVRQSAFNYVNELVMYNDTVVNNLINACTHHNWRFREASRKQFTEVLKNPGTQEAIQSRIDTFTKAEKAYLLRIFPKE